MIYRQRTWVVCRESESHVHHENSLKEKRTSLYLVFQYPDKTLFLGTRKFCQEHRTIIDKHVVSEDGGGVLL